MSDSSTGTPAPSTAPTSVQPTGTVDATSSESSDEEVDAAEAAEVEKETKASRKKMKSFKVNGKSKDIEVDFDNEAELEKYIQKALGADEKFQEAAMTRKQAEQLVDMLRTNPRAVLSHPDLGLDIQKLAHEIINEQIEDMSKSPEQKRLEEMEKQLKAYEEDKKKLENEKREAELGRMEAEAFQQLDEQISKALASTSLPKSPYVVKRITDAMIEAVNLGYVNVTAEQVMPYVEEQLTNEIQRLFEESPDEVMEKLTGKGRLDKYRKARVAKAKAKPVDTPKQIKETGATSKSEQPKEESKASYWKTMGRW